MYFICIKIHKKHLYIEQCWLSSKLYKSVEKEYDIAISYHAPNTIPVFYTIDKIKAKKKILWLHGDLGSNGGSTALAIEYYKQFDRIYVVADYIKKEFVKFIPEKKDAIEIFHNFFYPEQIIKKAKNGVSYTDNYEGIRILSIGRISNQKGYDMAVNVCQRLKANGFDFRWYICINLIINLLSFLTITTNIPSKIKTICFQSLAYIYCHIISLLIADSSD